MDSRIRLVKSFNQNLFNMVLSCALAPTLQVHPTLQRDAWFKIKQPTLGLSTYLQSFPRIPAQIVVKFCKALKTTAAGVQHQVAKLTRRKEIAGKLLNSRHGDLRNGDIKLTGK